MYTVRLKRDQSGARYPMPGLFVDAYSDEATAREALQDYRKPGEHSRAYIIRESDQAEFHTCLGVWIPTQYEKDLTTA